MKRLILVVGTAVVIGTTGCGALRGGKPAEDSQAVHLASSFNLRLVRAGEDPDLPNPEASLTGDRREDRMLSEGNQLMFDGVIHLPDAKNPKALFFVWSDAWLGATIQSAFVEHRLADDYGKYSGAPERRPALYQLDEHRWYLPFSAFFSSDSEGADPSREHTLTFELMLSDGSLKRVGVRLHVAGAAPRVSQRELDLGIQRKDVSSSELWQEIHGGVPIRSVELSNVSHRRARVWLFGESAEPLRLETRVGQITYSQEKIYNLPLYREPKANPIAWRLAQAKLRVSAVLVEKSIGQVLERETLMLEKGRASIPLLPGEEVRVTWLARAFEGEVECPLPAPVRHLEWIDPSLASVQTPCHVGLDLSSECLAAITKKGEFAEPWLIGGYTLAGVWGGGLQVENPWALRPAGLDSKGADERPASSVALTVQRGETREAPAGMYSCQGVF